MGRDKTGTWTVYESMRLELTYLLKSGFIRKGCLTSGKLKWSNNYGEDIGNIDLIADYTGKNCHLLLCYSISQGDSKKLFQYRIDLFQKDSNLKKGKVLYFICPETSKRCRILYMAYGYPKFKSRLAYTNRLYYDCQIASKLWKYNESYWRLQTHLDRLKSKACGGKRVFKGSPTKAAKRFQTLYTKQIQMDKLRYTLGVPKVLRHLKTL